MREQIENLRLFVLQQQIEFDKRLSEFNSTGLMCWNENTWSYGEKGIAWLKEGKNHGLHFTSLSGMKGIYEMTIDPQYVDFMRAVIVMETFRSNKIPSGTALEKRLNIMRRWYFEMIQMTTQTHPMYLTSDIIHAAMKRHHENSSSPSNVSDYCDLAVGLTKLLRPLNLTLVILQCENKYPRRNTISNTKARKIADMNPDDTDDSKLISIRSFMCIIEMIFLAKTEGEKIFLNFILLLIVTGFRFQEAQSLKINALIKRTILDENKLLHARKNGLPEYSRGIKYLGAKKAGWRMHWLAPSTIKLVESIFDAVIELTQESRSKLVKYRESNFSDFLPQYIKNHPEDLVEISELDGHLFIGSGGTRGHAGLRKSMVTAFYAKGIRILPTKIIEHSQTRKSFFYTKTQINEFIKFRYKKIKSFDKGYECKLVLKDDGKLHAFNYEDLLFIAPSGSFGLSVDLITLSNPIPLEHSIVSAWLGSNDSRQSFFEKLGMTEDDGGRIQLNTHFPRHNINTFLAIAGVTDHLQAMLMGRLDITQNQFYQHQADSHSYLAASLAAMSIEKKINSDANIIVDDNEQFGLFNPADNHYSELVSSRLVDQSDGINRRISALAHRTNEKLVSGVDAVKKYGAIFINPTLGMEDNLKQNMHTLGVSRSEISAYINNTMSTSFLSDLKIAHDRLLAAQQNKLAKELIERHAKLHSMPIGSCTRDVARWGCPFAMRCQSGEPCGYFTLTGRLDEFEAIKSRLSAKIYEVKQLEKLYKIDSSFKIALKEQRDALVVLEGFQQQVFLSLKDKHIVSLFSKDKDNPLLNIVERINEQALIGKSPNTLADLFFIEQKRIERAGKIED